jgi:hypothetical protein
LHAGISKTKHVDELCSSTDAACGDDRHAKITHFIQQGLRCAGTGVAARARVHADESIHAPVARLERPFPLRHIVVHDTTDRMGRFHHPAGVAQ